MGTFKEATGGIANVVVKRAVLVPLSAQQSASNHERIIAQRECLDVSPAVVSHPYLIADRHILGLYNPARIAAVLVRSGDLDAD
jgi:hypothetical protein